MSSAVVLLAMLIPAVIFYSNGMPEFGVAWFFGFGVLYVVIKHAIKNAIKESREGKSEK